jgi:hypothetical protein
VANASSNLLPINPFASQKLERKLFPLAAARRNVYNIKHITHTEKLTLSRALLAIYYPQQWRERENAAEPSSAVCV